ncbi:restriction endonuclease subunit S [Empedobacter stercoris]|uniref:restriction endonuclease subunit S n=1 Tax=Empedobacter stercoris TaxID=1628248 RepID=UPI0016628359|nr:restriction endonuclease subunit S [Empedobacter stercoris]MCA4809812.1 restriction endonuclease subunit S [Empedobacter stercoris]QNT13938.1 hypothetical protein HNV03_04295 [Empedobacter stercoris]
MAKGNRIINDFEDNVWLDVFYNSVGTYVNVINKDLSEIYKPEPLSKYIKIGGGYAFKTAQYKKEGIPVIRISDFNNEKIDISNCIFYDEDDSLSKYELKEGDIIICLTGGTIGKLGIVQAGLGKLYLNQRVGRFDVLDENIFEKEYVYWIARSVQDTIKQLAWGAAIPNVSPKQIEQLKFSIPNIDEQRAIIEFLNDLKSDSIQDKEYFNKSIENHILELHQTNINLKLATKEITHQLDLIKNLRQAFLREAMQGLLVSNETSDDKTGADLLAQIQAEKAQLVKEKKIKKPKPLAPIIAEEIPFDIPENWTWCRLGEVSDITRGKGPKYSENGANLMLNQKCVRWFTIDAEYAKSIDLDWYNSLDDLYKLKLNDILVNSTGEGTIGRSGMANENTVNYAYDSHTLKVRSFVNQSFICSFINSEYGQKQVEDLKGAKSTKQTELGATNLNNFAIPLPPLEIQECIVAKLDELMSYCDALEEQVKQSQQTNELLLQQVLREALGA